MKHIIGKLIDPSLKPMNAKIKGYAYIDDIVISLDSVKQSTLLFLRLLYNHHLRLGMPRKCTNTDNFGLYVPFRELSKFKTLNID